MDFLCYHRDRAGSTPLRVELRERHWAYMDGFADAMIARGPTFADDDTLTGSVHVLSLPDPAAARAFAFDEPGYQAGAYRDVLVRRWHNALGRTMWQYDGGRVGWFVLGFTPGPLAVDDAGLAAGPDDAIAYGPLLSDDGSAVVGVAALVEAPDEAAAAGVLPGGLVGVEVHRWQFGGRPG